MFGYGAQVSLVKQENVLERTVCPAANHPEPVNELVIVFALTEQLDKQQSNCKRKDIYPLESFHKCISNQNQIYYIKKFLRSNSFLPHICVCHPTIHYLTCFASCGRVLGTHTHTHQYHSHTWSLVQIFQSKHA